MGQGVSRLRAGNPTWRDQVAIRACGLVLLIGFPGVIAGLIHARHAAFMPLTDLQALLIALIGVLCLVIGLNLLFVGPCLFALHPWPGRFRRDAATAHREW